MSAVTNDASAPKFSGQYPTMGEDNEGFWLLFLIFVRRHDDSIDSRY
jgi:hypothetical protein